MWETLVLLLTGHLLGDFVFQTGWMVANKNKPLVLALHVGVVTAITAVLLGSLHWPILLLVYSSHLLIDTMKVRLMSDGLGPFIFDQWLHIVIIAGLAITYPEVASQSIWRVWIPVENVQLLYMGMTFVSALVLVVPAGGYLIGIMVKPLAVELKNEVQGLTRGGQYIGWLERALVMLFVFTGQHGSVGFVLAAKSILRFGEIKEAKQRCMAEYIIIGTFLSFGWALLVSNLAVFAIRWWAA